VPAELEVIVVARAARDEVRPYADDVLRVRVSRLGEADLRRRLRPSAD
jgi:hypothetical protein